MHIVHSSKVQEVSGVVTVMTHISKTFGASGNPAIKIL